MEKKPTYAGKIQNTGTQKVTAPFASKKGKAGKVTKGEDLRKGGRK